MRSTRLGFTLVEILVVIAILVGVTTIVVLALQSNSGQKVRDAARIGQATVLGARDRALHAQERRGIRLLIDPNNSNPANGPVLATGFVYVQPIPVQSYPAGSIQLERFDGLPAPTGDNVADSPEVVIVRGLPGNDWTSLQSFFSVPPKIRIPAGTGQWYTFSPPQAPYSLTTEDPVIQLTSAFVDPGTSLPTAKIAWPSSSGSPNTSCDIEIRSELLPNHSPIYLPSGVVIDLSLSQPTSSAAVAFPDIMFSARGSVVPAGVNALVSPVYLFLRDVRDALARLDPSSQQLQGDQMILTIFPQTGNVAAFPVDPADQYTNGTSNATPDGLADDPFRFAKAGQGAAG